MSFPAAKFVFEPVPALRRAERVLIKPDAALALPYPVTTSREMMENIIAGIRRVTDADILILEGNSRGEPMQPTYRALGYDFPRVLTLDVKDSVCVEVENPLPHPYIFPTFWVPNVVLFCDYLISVSPFKVVGGHGKFSIANLLGLLPASKYRGDTPANLESLYKTDELGRDKVIADLYFTLPFDLGIVEGRYKFVSGAEPGQGEKAELGQVFVGEPFEVDLEASRATGVATPYLDLIVAARKELESTPAETDP